MPLTIWSAACSSGPELYSAMMVARDLQRPGDGLMGIGTDISRPILRRAERAVYTAEEISGLPEADRRAHLLRARNGADAYRIARDLRERARWHLTNLVGLPDLPPFRAHAAFLRNVLIYFDAPTRDRVVRGVVARLAPGGYLLTGHSETLVAAHFGLSPVRPSIYRKAPE